MKKLLMLVLLSVAVSAQAGTVRQPASYKEWTDGCQSGNIKKGNSTVSAIAAFHPKQPSESELAKALTACKAEAARKVRK